MKQKELEFCQKILKWLKENPGATAEAIAKVFDVDAGEVKKKLKELGVEV
ncbi:MAG: helix-turn-helix transcriptional regulator [Firmicutes bacterium]|nr:helix-turn-helix transcriptional regulator [Bacillota bacterium]